ncbi:MAG: thioredoxin-disulfide reductase [Aeriscardovia sp.]|nr:thioredoxin-disulfide reductase [Aeriscardovia sp.]
MIDTSKVYDSVIIGSGPAGYTAGIYLGRAGFKPLLLTGSLLPGGELTETTLVENYPGFPEGVQGPDLMENMKAQAEKFDVQLESEDAEGIEDGENSCKIVKTRLGKIMAKTVVVATGSTHRKLEIPGEKEYAGLGVSYCATCDGFFFKNKKIAVIGGGDSALTDALFLTRFSDCVYLIHRRDTFRSRGVLPQRVQECLKIKIEYNSLPIEVLGDGEKVTGIKLKDRESGNERELQVDAIFVDIGSVPQTGFLGNYLELDPAGYILIKDSSSLTSKPAVFAAGDCADPVYRQAVTAAGSGCKAAIDAQRYLLN